VNQLMITMLHNSVCFRLLTTDRESSSNITTGAELKDITAQYHA